MPRLPTVEDFGQRPTPRMSRAVVPLQLETPRQGFEAQAMGGIGQATSELGIAMDRMISREKDRIDTTRVEEAYTELSQRQMALEYDEKEGYRNILGGDVVKRPLIQEWQKKSGDIAKEIEEKLSNPEQQRMFHKRAEIANRVFTQGLFRHVAEQTNRYQQQTYETTLAFERNKAATAWDQPGALELSLNRIFSAIDREADRLGVPPETVAVLKQQEESKLHSDVLRMMLVKGQDQAAKSYYEQVKGKLDPEALITLGRQVQIASTEEEGLRSADEIWNAFGPKNPNDAVKLATMEAAALERHKGNPDVIKAVRAELRSRTAAFNEEQQELTAQNKSTVLQMYHDGKPFAQIQRSPEYKALAGDEKNVIRDYVINRGYTLQQRARADAAYKEGEKARNGWRRYWDLSQPRELIAMPESQIMALEPELGRELVSDLMNQKRRLMGTEQKIREATIDADMFNQIASDAGLDPYAKTLLPTNKERLGRLKNHVETVIDQAQQQLGRQLSRTEKEKLMREEVDRKVMVDVWGKDPSVPAASIRRKEREDVYVPIGEIPPQWTKEAINYMRSIGIVPMAMTDAAAQRKMQGRLQKAYGLRLIDGSRQEIEQVLRGEK